MRGIRGQKNKHRGTEITESHHKGVGSLFSKNQKQSLTCKRFSTLERFAKRTEKTPDPIRVTNSVFSVPLCFNIYKRKAIESLFESDYLPSTFSAIVLRTDKNRIGQVLDLV